MALLFKIAMLVAMALGNFFSCGEVPAGAPEVAPSYPSNVIRIVIGAPAGVPSDIVGRIIANELGQTEGWRIIVENRIVRFVRAEP